MDVGTGTGIWAMYVLLYRNCGAKGTGLTRRAEISRTKTPAPRSSARICRQSSRPYCKKRVRIWALGSEAKQGTRRPPNCRFELDDATENWTFPENHFDFVHTRMLYGSIDDWPKYYEQAFRAIKPGGWFQQLEMSILTRCDDDTLEKYEDKVLKEWGPLFINAADSPKFGRTLDVWKDMRQHMIDAGFEDVHQVDYKVPIGPWSSDPRLKEIGKWHLLYCFQGAEGWAMYLCTHVLGVSLGTPQLRCEMF